MVLVIKSKQPSLDFILDLWIRQVPHFHDSQNIAQLGLLLQNPDLNDLPQDCILDYVLSFEVLKIMVEHRVVLVLIRHIDNVVQGIGFLLSEQVVLVRKNVLFELAVQRLYKVKGIRVQSP